MVNSDRKQPFQCVLMVADINFDMNSQKKTPCDQRPFAFLGLSHRKKKEKKKKRIHPCLNQTKPSSQALQLARHWFLRFQEGLELHHVPTMGAPNWSHGCFRSWALHGVEAASRWTEGNGDLIHSSRRREFSQGVLGQVAVTAPLNSAVKEKKTDPSDSWSTWRWVGPKDGMEWWLMIDRFVTFFRGMQISCKLQVTKRLQLK